MSKTRFTNVTCLPASYQVEYADGTLIESGIIASGGSKTITVPDFPPVVYRRPHPDQYFGYETDDSYDQFFIQNYWQQADGFQRILDYTDQRLRTLKDLTSIGIDNTNPLNNFKRFSRLNNPNDTSISAFSDWDFSIPYTFQRGYVFVDWWSGVMWLLVDWDSNKNFFQIRDVINDPLSGTDYESTFAARALDSNGLIYGFDDWKVPPYNVVNTIWDVVRGVLTVMQDSFDTAFNRVPTPTIRGNRNYSFDRMDSGNDDIFLNPITNNKTDRTLICRRIQETEY